MRTANWITLTAKIDFKIEDVGLAISNEMNWDNQVRRSLAQGRAFVRSLSDAGTLQQLRLKTFSLPPINTSFGRGHSL